MQLWGARTDAADAREVHRLGQRFLTSSTAPRVALVFIEDDSTPPDGDARTELGRLSSLFRSSCQAIAYVYAGQGFRAAAIRSVMGAILLVGSLQPGTTTPRTFADAAAALSWVSSRLPASTTEHNDRRLRTFDTVVRAFRERAQGRSTSASSLHRIIEDPGV